MIDWANFTPYSALIGGALIGLSATLFFMANGRIAGISGITAAIFNLKASAGVPRLYFLLGLFLAPWLWMAFAPMPNLDPKVDLISLISAGLLVGYGTRLGSGCTSGHGVCGLGRFSTRSLVATLIFMGVAALTVGIRLHGGAL